MDLGIVLKQETVLEHAGNVFMPNRGVLVQEQKPGVPLRLGKFHSVVVGARGSHIWLACL